MRTVIAAELGEMRSSVSPPKNGTPFVKQGGGASS